jgi:hypothetical protein
MTHSSSLAFMFVNLWHRLAAPYQTKILCHKSMDQWRGVLDKDDIFDVHDLSKASYNMKREFLRAVRLLQDPELEIFGGVPRDSFVSCRLVEAMDGDLAGPFKNGSFLSPASDIDLYNRGSTSLPDLLLNLQALLPSYRVTGGGGGGGGGYVADHISMSTHPHPLAPVLFIRIDITDDEKLMDVFPDFNVNQLSVSRAGNMSVFHPTNLAHCWWENMYKPLDDDSSFSLVEFCTGAVGDDAVARIRADIDHMVARPLVYKFSDWRRLRGGGDVDAWCRYVRLIVIVRGRKLMRKGFRLLDVLPIGGVEEIFECGCCGRLTAFDDVQIIMDDDYPCYRCVHCENNLPVLRKCVDALR